MIESGFFNSVNGDRKYNADDISRYFENIISSGLFERIENNCKVTATGGMNLSVAAGGGILNCRYFRVTSAESLTVSTANAALPRIDAVVARLDTSDAVRGVVLRVNAGTPSASPVAPAPERTATVYEIALAHVYVGAGVTAITADNITDKRGVYNVCEWANSMLDRSAVKVVHDRYTAPSDNTTDIPLTISGFNSSYDAVNVYVNGFRMEPGTEYTVSDDDDKIILAEGVDAGTVVGIEAIMQLATGSPKSMQLAVLDMMDDLTALAGTVEATRDQADTLNNQISEYVGDTGWVSLAAGISVRKVGNHVMLRGGTGGGAFSDGASVVTLPAEYRPSFALNFATTYTIVSSDSTEYGAANLTITTSGAVMFKKCVGQTAWGSDDTLFVNASWLVG